MAQFAAGAETHHAGQFGPPLPPWPLAGFVAAILAVVVIALLSYRSLQSREENANQVTASLGIMMQMQTVLSRLQDAETGQRGYLLTGEGSYLEPYTNARATLAGVIEQARSDLNGTRHVQSLDAIEKLATAKMAELAEAIALRDAGKTNEAITRVRTDRGKNLMDQLRDAIAGMQEEERTELEQRQAQWRLAVNNSVWIVFGGSALLLLLIVAAALSTSREHRARQTLNWLRTGQMNLATSIQGERRLDVIGNNVLERLAGYLSADVGALYLAHDRRFRRVAGYAIEPGALELERGDGLVGQAAKENRALHVKDVPAEHIAVASGIGRSPPSELLIMPASVEGSVYAVVELGFFRQIGDAERRLLELVSEPIAMAVRAALDHGRLAELLEETQRQASELQAQQEELRVTNEELEQQSNVLRESQARLESQQAELEQTNVQLEEHSQQLARQNDDIELARAELAAKATELERSNQFKSEFLANMSHELRTPLNSSLILAKLLGDNPSGNLTEEQIKFARNIYSAGNDLLELINDILDLSKIEARKVEVSRETISVPQLIDNLSQTFRPMADQKAIGFEATIEPGTPALMHSDSQRVRQVLKNLLSNAIKFTAKGGVKLRVFSPSGTAEGEQIGFEVIDTGIGIAPEQHEIIFEPFRQADGTTNRRFGGTGLGLSISRELSALLGGRIELHSTPGVGSTFALVLPCMLPERPAAETPTPAVPAAASPPRRQRAAPTQPVQRAPRPVAVERSGEGRLLLIIEDDVTFANTLADLAASQQFECLIALSADEGIEMALRYRPTAIVLDIQLPDHTGLTVLDRLKHNPTTRHIPVQVISGFDYTQAALEMGAASFMLKPVDRDRLVDALSNLERKMTDEARAVLIVEDNSIQRDSIQQLLKSSGVRAVAVASAADALEQLRTSTFDCMVLDLALPDASGFELLEKMANDDAYAFPPVIVYTARAVSQVEEQQLRRYSKSIIIKGAKSPERLLDEVTLFLHKVEESLPAEQQRLLRMARSRESVFEGRRVLLVEDDVRNVFAITRVLEPHGAKLEIARNGIEALAALKQHSDIELVLMDIMMPEMDGLQAMQEIRKQPALAKLPIIALTAKAMPDDRQRCLDAGANDYITKPIDIEKLLSLLRIWLPARRGALA